MGQIARGVLQVGPLRGLYAQQQAIARTVIAGMAGLIFVVCGRRFGKTFCAAQIAVSVFLTYGWRVMYAAPSLDQADEFWSEVLFQLQPLIDQGSLLYNKQRRIITATPAMGLPRAARLRATHGHKPNMLRGGWGDLIILDEFQDHSEDIFEKVIQPMRYDKGGKVLFLFTPPNVMQTKPRGRNPLHARDLVWRLQGRKVSGWPQTKPNRNAVVYNWPSHVNPYLNEEVMEEVHEQTSEMTWRQETLAHLIADNPFALWRRDIIHTGDAPPYPHGYERIVVGVDPAGGGRSQVGIVVVGRTADDHLWVLADWSLYGSPAEWAAKVASAYYTFGADAIVAETNYGGEMVPDTLLSRYEYLPVNTVNATQDKPIRADPVVALYEHKRITHAHSLTPLEDQMCAFVPNTECATDRVDALVWACHDVLFRDQEEFFLYRPGGRRFSEALEVNLPPRGEPIGAEIAAAVA